MGREALRCSLGASESVPKNQKVDLVKLGTI